MFIRRSPTRNKATGESYFTFRLVRTERVGGKVRQVTLLNLGRHFPVPQDEWPSLCSRIEQLTCGQASLLPVERSAAIAVGNGDRHPLPPNPLCGFPATGSPVS